MRFVTLHLAAASLLWLAASVGRAAEPGDWEDPSWQLLRGAGVHRDGPSLAAYLRDQCGDDADLARIDALTRQLGSDSFDEREEATKALAAVGAPALAKLRAARRGPDAEAAQRAAACIARIEKKWKPELALAAVRVLVRRGATEAIPDLMRFLPCADFEELQDALWFGLDSLTVRQGKIDPRLTDALRSPVAVRRAAAACIVGRRGDAEQRAAVQKLLSDAEPEVRLRAAQGLLAARDKTGVPALIALLGGVAGRNGVAGGGAAALRRRGEVAGGAGRRRRGGGSNRVPAGVGVVVEGERGRAGLCQAGRHEPPAGADAVVRRRLAGGGDGPRLAARLRRRDALGPAEAVVPLRHAAAARRAGRGRGAVVDAGQADGRNGRVGARIGWQGAVAIQGVDEPMTCLPMPYGRLLVAGSKLMIAEVDAAGNETVRKDFTAKAFDTLRIRGSLIAKQPHHRSPAEPGLARAGVVRDVSHVAVERVPRSFLAAVHVSAQPRRPTSRGGSGIPMTACRPKRLGTLGAKRHHESAIVKPWVWKLRVTGSLRLRSSH